jgi:hypothetical protein
MDKLVGPKLEYKGPGKGHKTAGRTNWRRWFNGEYSDILPKRVVKLWPRDKEGNLK